MVNALCTDGSPLSCMAVVRKYVHGEVEKQLIVIFRRTSKKPGPSQSHNIRLVVVSSHRLPGSVLRA